MPTPDEIRAIVKEEIQNAFQDTIREECRAYLAVLKDTLMASLIGFMNEERRILEEKYGSGRVQEVYGEQNEGLADRDPDLEYPEDKQTFTNEYEATMENTRIMG